MPAFLFNKAFGIARDAKVSLIRRKLKSREQELSRIRSGLRAAKEQAEILEHKKRKKRKKQEIFQLNGELRAAEERAKGIPDGRGVAGEPETGTLPDFVIIGAKKCGTSSLYRLLTRHPHVEPAAAKELNYFGGLLDEGIEWYRRCFPPPRWKDGRRSITGEATPGYLFHPLVPEEMAKVVPQARLIALLRNPVDRAYSDYNQRVKRGREPRTFEEAVEAEKTRLFGKEDEAAEPEEHTDPYDAPYYDGYLYKGIYVDHLQRWSKFFGDEQMLVLKSEDFFERTLDALKLVLNFLDLPDWEPEAWEIRNKGNYEQSMDPTTRQQLGELFEPRNRRLYEYLGVDFGW